MSAHSPPPPIKIPARRKTAKVAAQNPAAGVAESGGGGGGGASISPPAYVGGAPPGAPKKNRGEILNIIRKNARDAAVNAGIEEEADKISNYSVKMAEYLLAIYPTLAHERAARIYLDNKLPRDNIKDDFIAATAEKLILYRNWLITGHVWDDEEYGEAEPILTSDRSVRMAEKLGRLYERIQELGHNLARVEKGNSLEPGWLANRQALTTELIAAQKEYDDLSREEDFLAGGKRTRRQKNRRNRKTRKHKPTRGRKRILHRR